MTSIQIRPSIPSWAEHPEDFDGVVEALAGGDAEVVLVEPPPPPPSMPGAAGMDFVVHLVGDITPYLLPWVVEKLGDALISAAKRRGRETPVTGVIYGPDGEILSEVTLHPDGDRDHPT